MSCHGYSKYVHVMAILRMFSYYVNSWLCKECSVTMSCVSYTKNVQLLCHVIVILSMFSYYDILGLCSECSVNMSYLIIIRMFIYYVMP
jgi:hypothetical protein